MVGGGADTFTFINYACDATQACWVLSKAEKEPRRNQHNFSTQAETNDADIGRAAIEEVCEIMRDAPEDIPPSCNTVFLSPSAELLCFAWGGARRS